ncbi:uncharacterized protein LOC142531215 [Primulina tabacum]|uniref:uncharacterized protein LOC142531215 n=1 Tax=Primulina tabacum TaxID=48773 RepID=UPI003F5A9D25
MELRAGPGDTCSSSSTPIDSSNIGFRLLKKHGWREGTGLGISEQGRLEPIQAHVRKNKQGLGADKPKEATIPSKFNEPEDPKLSKMKAKVMSKKLKKMQEFEKQLQEKELERAFFREFWPDNV